MNPMADAERARQALADFRRGPIKRSKLHPKDKVKSFQSPQLFGPQNGAGLSSKYRRRTVAALFASLLFPKKNMMGRRKLQHPIFSL